MESRTNVHDNAVAITGMNGRFPGAPSLEAYWANLIGGVNSISRGPAPAHGSPRKTGYAGFLAGVDLFDAEFFGFKAAEAETTDPQHRLLLECAWAAMEDAGYVGETTKAEIGVFVGASPAWYSHRLYQNAALLKSVGLLQVMLGNDQHFLATRLSYKLDLRGPSVVVQSACSTSLTAVHYACQSLLNGECDMALAGGVGLTASCNTVLDGDIDIFSQDGVCRTFDADARGTVPGEGLGIVVLKRLADAVRDRDHVRAVILGSAVNNDGADKANYLTPSVKGQSRAVAEALQVSGISARTISYVEAHGTATPIGDPIEFQALSQAFRADTNDTQFCTLGSVKPNIGHLDAAAGIASLIKCVLALEHRYLPGTLHFNTPNPEIDLPSSPFHITGEAQVWEAGQHPRRASINACGFGGTNAHLIVQEAPAKPVRPLSPGPELWLLSARSAAALEDATGQLVDWLQAASDHSLADAAHTLRVGRKGFACRRMVVARDRQEAITALTSTPARGAILRRSIPAEVLQINSDLLETRSFDEISRFSERFRLLMEECRAVSEGEVLRGETLLFAQQWSLASWLIACGAAPAAFAGDGVGELVAACLAGVFSLQQALLLLHEPHASADFAPRTPSSKIFRCAGRVELIAREWMSPAYWAAWRHRRPIAVGSQVGERAPLLLPATLSAVLEMLGASWIGGAEIDWLAVYQSQPRCRISLPGYPFERKRFWIDEGLGPVTNSFAAAGQQAGEDRLISAAAAEKLERLQAIWAEALGPKYVGRGQDFFDAGGDSLVAVQLLSRVRRSFLVDLSMEQFFDNPTLAGLHHAVQTATTRATAVPFIDVALSTGRSTIGRAAARAAATA